MDDMTAFEREIGDELRREIGPLPGFDAMSIVRSVTATQSPKWRSQSMFSATKFVVAGAIVALFGGFLMAGVLTQPSEVAAPAASAATASPTAEASAYSTTPPDATTRSDLLPGVDLVTEEVEPGVFHVISDGARDLSRPVSGAGDGPQAFYRTNVVAGLDDSVWVFGHDEFYRVGDEHTYPAGTEIGGRQGQQAKVAPDGVLWTINGDNLVSFTDGTWLVGKEGVTAFDMQPDGTVWAVTTEGTLLRLESSTWVVAGGVSDGGDRVRDLWVSPVTHAFFAQSYGRPDAALEVLFLTDGGDGAVGGMDLSLGFPEPDGGSFGPAGALSIGIGPVDMDVHGDYWIYQQTRVPLAGQGLADSEGSSATIPYLVHVEGGPRTVYSSDDGVPLMGPRTYSWSFLRAAADGSVWLTPDVEDPASCEGIARFDGRTLARYLADVCVYAFDIAPDGAVWVQASSPPTATGAGHVNTYVIAPEAVAATE